MDQLIKTLQVEQTADPMQSRKASGPSTGETAHSEIAGTEFSYQRDFMVADTQSQDLNQRLGCFAHEVLNLVTTATLAVNIIKSGNVGMAGATGQILLANARGGSVGKRTDRLAMTAHDQAEHPVSG